MNINFLLAIGVIFCGTHLSTAQAPFSPQSAPVPSVSLNPLKAQAQLSQSHLPQGGNTTLSVDLNLEAGFHAYADRFQLVILEPDGIQLGSLKISPLVTFKDMTSNQLKRGIEGHAQLISSLEISTTIPLGWTQALLELTYQACTQTFCLLPKKITLPLDFQVSDSRHPSLSDKPQSFELQSAHQLNLINQVQEEGWFLVFLTIFFAGIVASFSPCIFPMIPITLAVIGSTGSSNKRWRNLFVAGVYVLGIVLSYSTLGVIAASTGSLFGSLLGHPYVAITFSLLFLLMSLSAFGLFSLQAPLWMRKRLGSMQSQNRWVSALIAGLLAGVIAGPCVGPVLVSILAFVAQTQDPVMGFLLLATFAFGMGQLFLFLGYWGHWVQRIPRAGSWMKVSQFIFGSLLLGLSIYYLNPFLSPAQRGALLGCALIFLAIRYGAFSAPGRSVKQMGIKFFFILLFSGGLIAFYHSIQQIGSQSPQIKEPQSESSSGWEPYTAEKLNETIKRQQPFILDFYADWCGSCKELEMITFADGKVLNSAKAKNFRLFRFDATQTSPEFETLQKQFHILGLPTVLFHDGKKWRSDLTLTGFENPEKFIQRLKSFSND